MHVLSKATNGIAYKQSTNDIGVKIIISLICQTDFQQTRQVISQHALKRQILHNTTNTRNTYIMSDTIMTVKIVPFSGKKEDWNRWSKTFLAASTVRGYREVIKPIDESAKIDAKKNIQANCGLMMSCEDNVSFGVVDESISTAFPDADARQAWINLYKKYEPTTGAMKLEDGVPTNEAGRRQQESRRVDSQT